MSTITCGVFNENQSYTLVRCNTETGECFFYDPVMGDPRLISEVSVNCKEDVDVGTLMQELVNGVYGKGIGLIADGDTVLLIVDENTAVRKSADPTQTEIIETLEINVYSDYDEDTEEDE